MMMKQALLLWNPSFHFLPPQPSLSSLKKPNFTISASSLDPPTTTEELTAKERRQLRNERRESKGSLNWREEVEERLITKPKKKKTSWTEQLNLDNLSNLGPQWWVIRGSRVRGQDTAQLLARSLARNFPDVEFKVITQFLNMI